jgi:hypothetical protein
MTATTEFRIYAACLASYNNGVLHGAWIDCSNGATGDEIKAEIAAMLAASPVKDAEEWAIHDHTGFAGLIRSEWPNIDEVAAIAAALGDGDEDKRRGLLWLVTDRGYEIGAALDRCEDVRTFEGSGHKAVEDYAYELASDTIADFESKAAHWPFNSIDWAQAGRDLVLGGDIDECNLDGEYFIVTNAAEF